MKLLRIGKITLATVVLSFGVAGSGYAQSDMTAGSSDSIQYLEKITPIMIPIPAGRFKMGCADSLDCADANEDYDFTDVKSFRMSESEITWDMYQPCIDEGACPDNSIDGGDNGWGKEDRPVINVNWFDIADHYIPWLSDKTGQSYRLPTHEEWEYASRGGTKTAFHWGDDVGSNLANCYGCGSQWDNEMSAPAKSFSPNAYGLYDMHGNVSEWTQSCFKGPYGRMKENCNSRIMPSGGFSSMPFIVTSSAFGGKALHRRGAYGIRLVQELEGSESEVSPENK